MRCFAKTDIGRKRELNEDYIYQTVENIGSLDNLFIVADGMGGHKAGDFASKNTVETLVREISFAHEDKEITAIIKAAIDKANAYIFKCSEENFEMRGMGSTLVVCTVQDKTAIIANVGDSRLYLIREGEILQITKDHSYVEEMVKLGEINREEARNHPDKNIITRAIGVKNDVNADFFTVDLKNKDKLLLCSDGLTNMLVDSEILDYIENFELEEAVNKLVEEANNKGGRDNISVVLVEPFGGQ